MLLRELIDQLSVGEFAQISLGGGAGIISTDEDYKKVMLHANLAASALYKRFNIKRGRVVLKITPTISSYAVKSSNSVLKPAGGKYVMDTLQNKFQDDINKIEKIYWEHNGEEVPLNEIDRSDSVVNSTLLTLEFPQEILKKLRLKPKADPSDADEWENNRLVVEYRAGYFPSVKLTDIAVPEVTVIDIPDMYLEALLYFVASRVHNPIGLVGESGFHQGNNFAAKYEAECQRLEYAGLQMDYTNPHLRFRQNGWV